MINVTESITNGKTYNNVAGITPLPGALKNAKPSPVHANVKFDLDEPDMKVFSTFHEKLQEAIKKSPEWAKAQGVKYTPSNSGSEFESESEEIPF